MDVSSSSEVLNTVELLEAILLFLPIGDVLLAQRISKQWHFTIIGSRRLQRALFLDPTTPKRKQDDSDVVFLNPLADKLLWVMVLWQVSLMDALPASWKYPEASWRRMHLTTPAVDAGFRINTFWFRLFNTGTYRLGNLVEELEEEYRHTGGRKNCVTRQDLHTCRKLEIGRDLDTV